MSSRQRAPRTIGEPQRSVCVAHLRERLLDRPEVVLACLHGSFHEGLPFRDVDVAVWLDLGSDADGEALYAMDLAISLTGAVGLTVDVQVLNTAPLAFRFHALQGIPLVVRDADFLAELRASTWDRYFDFQPFAMAYWREVVRA